MHILGLHFCKEKKIETIDTAYPRYLVCSYSKCNSVFPISSEKELQITKLCPSCAAHSQVNHIIQCRNCESILDFFEAEDFETPNVFYVERCKECKGTLEDEQKIQPFMFPNLML